MNIRDKFSNYLLNRLEKRGAIEDIMNGSVRFSGKFANESSILESSDLYELIQDISNQIAMAVPVVIGPDGAEIKNHEVINVLNKPNQYLTGFEFSKLETNTLLVQGENFPVFINDQLHLVNNVYPELDKNMVPHYKINGEEFPAANIRHVKNIGTSHSHGVGILQLAKNTLSGVLSAEKVLTDKYIKGGLLAFLLKLDANINPKNGVQAKLVKRILDQLESIDDAHSVKMIPLGRGYEIQTLKSPVDDSAILNYLGVYKKDLGKFLGINVDTYQALMKTDVEQAMMYLHNKVVKPILQNKSEHYSALFFGPDSKYQVKWQINILDFVSYSTKTNIGYNIVRTGITSPDEVAEMLGFPRQDTPESQAIYISNDLTEIGKKNATDDSLDNEKGGDKDAKKETDEDV